MKEIGVEYQSIDACPNDHIIYYGQKTISHNVKLVDIKLIK